MTGVLFADLLEKAGGDFFRIPNIRHINRLAEITVTDRASGAVCRAGRMHPEILLEALNV